MKVPRVSQRFVIILVIIFCVSFLTTFLKDKNMDLHVGHLTGHIEPLHNFIRTVFGQDKHEDTISTNYEYNDINFDNTERGVRLEWPEHDEQALGVYILTAIGSNTSCISGHKRDIKLNGWWSTKHNNENIKCCLLWSNKTLSEFKHPDVEKRSSSTQFVATQISCPLNASFSDVEGVALQFAGTKCPEDDKMYTKPAIAVKSDKDESFSVCLKIVYGTVNNRNLIDYLEFLRVMQVEKVFMFYYDITTETNAVIDHYVQLGLVDSRPFNYPLNSTRNLGEKRMSVYEDQRVPLLDCIQRSSGYKYMAVIDMDEYLLPKKHDNYKDLMKHLMRTYPNAAGFKFDSFLFVKDVGPDPNAPANGSDIVKYFQRSDAFHGGQGRNKILILPSRVMTKGYYTHGFIPLKNYQKVHVSMSIAAINHYRMCYSDTKSVCSGKLIEDRSILKYVKNFQNNTSRLVI